MLNFQAIRQSIINTDYGFDKPKSLIVLVPIASLIFQKIQVSNLINTLKNTYTRPHQCLDLINSREYKKLNTVHNWHVLGSLIQTISLLFLINFHPLFLIPAVFSIYELSSSANKIMHEVIQLDGRGLYIEK